MEGGFIRDLEVSKSRMSPHNGSLDNTEVRDDANEKGSEGIQQRGCRQDIESSDDEDVDILSSALSTLYSYTPITHAAAGDKFVYEYDSKTKGERDKLNERDHEKVVKLKVELQTPDTSAKNWSLHASSIWVSAVYLADHISDLGLSKRLNVRQNGGDGATVGTKLEILELGAGAGLPGILVAKILQRAHQHEGNWRVTLSDYPDQTLIETLRRNALSNGLSPSQGRVVPYAWGSDPSPLLASTSTGDTLRPQSDGFDLIIAADVLWNAALHDVFVQSLHSLLRRTKDSRVYLVAGLHTGRYTIRGFLQAATKETGDTQQGTSDGCKNGAPVNIMNGSTPPVTPSKKTENFRTLEIEHIEEREVVAGLDSGSYENIAQRREWSADRNGEDEMERRRWVVWIVLKWKC